MSYLGMSDTALAQRVQANALKLDRRAAINASLAAKEALAIQLKKQSADTKATMDALQQTSELARAQDVTAADIESATRTSEAKAAILRSVPYLIGGVVVVAALAILKKKR